MVLLRKIFGLGKKIHHLGPEPDPYFHRYAKNIVLDDKFYFNLCTTIQWCNSIMANYPTVERKHLHKIFRQLNPVYDRQPLYDFSCYGFPASPYNPINYDAILNDIMPQRVVKDISRDEEAIQGKILTFAFAGGWRCGVHIIDTFSFIEEGDRPPIDTWFYVTQTYLYCWIPSGFIDLIQNEIDKKRCNSFRWLGESEPLLNYQIVTEAAKRLE